MLTETHVHDVGKMEGKKKVMGSLRTQIHMEKQDS